MATNNKTQTVFSHNDSIVVSNGQLIDFSEVHLFDYRLMPTSIADLYSA